MAEGKVVPEGVRLIEMPEAPCNVQRHGPTRTLHLRQSDVAGNTRNMRVERNDQLAWTNAIPYAAVDSIRRADHPSQKKIHPLAGATVNRRRQQEPDANSSLEFARGIEALVSRSQHRGREAGKRGAGVRVGGRQPGKKCILQRTVLFKQSANHPKENGEIAARVEAVIEGTQAARVLQWIECGKRLRGCRAQERKRTSGRCEDGFDVAVRKRRNDESRDFAIARIVIAVDKLNRVVGDTALLRKVRKEGVEMKLQVCDCAGGGCHVRGRLPLLARRGGCAVRRKSEASKAAQTGWWFRFENTFCRS